MNGPLKGRSGSPAYNRNCADCLLQEHKNECAAVTRPPHGGASLEGQCPARDAGFSVWAECAIASGMNAIVDPNGPSLAIVPSNPVPEGARVGMFTTSDGINLRYATFPKGPGAARGTICLVQGRTEFIEKYFETIADFQKRGFAVATFDWRGQGGSQRLIGNARLGYVKSYDDYWTDLKSFHGSILLPDCPGPYYLV